MDPAKKDVFQKALASNGKCLHKLVQMLTYLGPSVKSASDLSNHDQVSLKSQFLKSTLITSSSWSVPPVIERYDGTPETCCFFFSFCFHDYSSHQCLSHLWLLWGLGSSFLTACWKHQGSSLHNRLTPMEVAMCLIVLLLWQRRADGTMRLS